MLSTNEIASCISAIWMKCRFQLVFFMIILLVGLCDSGYWLSLNSNKRRLAVVKQRYCVESVG